MYYSRNKKIEEELKIKNSHTIIQILRTLLITSRISERPILMI